VRDRRSSPVAAPHSGQRDRSRPAHSRAGPEPFARRRREI